MLLSACGRATRDLPAAGVDRSSADQEISAEGKASLETYVDTAQLPDLQYPNFKNLRSAAKEFYRSTGDALPWVVERRKRR